MEDLVALAITRSATLLTAIWAVAKTGGGYVPIDPDYPPERVAAMIEDSGASWGAVYMDSMFEVSPFLVGMAFVALQSVQVVARLSVARLIMAQTVMQHIAV